MVQDVKLRGTLRALAVLQALNRQNGSTVVQLHKTTGIPRPSLYRILGTLCSTGYIRQRPDQSYALTYLVRSLSDGFRDEDWVSEVAAPVLDELQREILWPTDLSTFLNYAMHLRETTRPHSPLTIDRATVGYRLPLLATSLGLAYLAFCPAKEQAALLANLARSDDPFDALARAPREVERLLRETRKNGYAARFRGVIKETGSIAIPIMSGERVMASIGVTFIASALTPKEAADRYLDALKAAGAKIEKALRY